MSDRIEYVAVAVAASSPLTGYVYGPFGFRVAVLIYLSLILVATVYRRGGSA